MVWAKQQGMDHCVSLLNYKSEHTEPQVREALPIPCGAKGMSGAFIPHIPRQVEQLNPGELLEAGGCLLHAVYQYGRRGLAVRKRPEPTRDAARSWHL